MSTRIADDMAISIFESLVARTREGEDLPVEEITKFSSIIINNQLAPVDV
jgi:hypothetical protein